MDAKDFAKIAHKNVNQRYGNDLPYHFHTDLVYRIGQIYCSLVDDNCDEVLSACALHDTIEDAHQSYNDIKTKFGLNVAEIVFAVTNNKGRTRKDRANDSYYEGIRTTRGATFVKLCDRIANVLYSAMFGGRMFDMYCKEHEVFVEQLYDDKYEIMFKDLKTLFETRCFDFSVRK